MAGSRPGHHRSAGGFMLPRVMPDGETVEYGLVKEVRDLMKNARPYMENPPTAPEMLTHAEKIKRGQKKKGGIKAGEEQQDHGRHEVTTGVTLKQEKFCQEYIRGFDYVSAYIAAGYELPQHAGDTDYEHKKRIRRSALCLAARPAVRARLDALQKELHEKLSADRMNLADEYNMNVRSMTEMLLEDREFARTGKLSLKPTPEGEEAPKPVVNWRPDARAAVQATGLLAKLHGLMIDRAEVSVQGTLTQMTNEELVAFIHKLHGEVGPIIDITPATDELAE